MTVADDKSLGGFRCESIDSTATTWKRAIQVQVIGKFKTVADYKKGVPKVKYAIIQFFPLGLV